MTPENPALAAVRWARSRQADFLTSRFYIFAKFSGMCPSITELEYADVCAWLESRLPDRAGVPRQKYGIFLMPRLTFKTSLISALIIYAYVKDKNIRITLGRATDTLAQLVLDGVKTELTSNKILREAFGDMRATFATWAATNITSGTRDPGLREPTVMTTSLGSSQTGQHPDLVVLDDLIHEQNYESAAAMVAAGKLVDSYTPVLERWGSLLLVGTRWGGNDVYGKQLEHNQKLLDEGKPPKWDTFIVGAYIEGTDTPRFPTVLPEARLQALRDAIPDPKLYASWYLNVTRTQEEDIFPAACMQHFSGTYTPGEGCGVLSFDSEPVNGAIVAQFGRTLTLATVLMVDPRSDGRTTFGLHRHHHHRIRRRWPVVDDVRRRGAAAARQAPRPHHQSLRPVRAVHRRDRERRHAGVALAAAPAGHGHPHARPRLQPAHRSQGHHAR